MAFPVTWEVQLYPNSALMDVLLFMKMHHREFLTISKTKELKLMYTNRNDIFISVNSHFNIHTFASQKFWMF